MEGWSKEMRLLATQYEAKYKNVRYKFSKSRLGWSVIKWSDSNPQIPPHMSILTVDGWQGVLQVEDDTYFRETAWELRMYVEKIS
jgi:hypothetical protein